MVSYPSQYAAMGWHQIRSASPTGTDPDGDGWFKPEVWHREEFSESDSARAARTLLDFYLQDAPLLLAHIGYLALVYLRPPGRPPAQPGDLTDAQGVRAVTAVATWLDELLYGQGREQLPKEERYTLQVTADSMARGAFCRMDFRALVRDCLAADVPPAPLSSVRPGRSV